MNPKECYWNYPLTGLNGKKENGSKKYRDYYFDNDGDLTNQQVADHFGLAEITIRQHRHNYQWDTVLADKKAYLQMRREKIREENYQKHIDKDFKNADTVLTIKYTQIQMAAVKVGIMKPIQGLTIPEELTFEKAWDTINRTDLKTLQTVIMRDLEKAGNINDKQVHNVHGEMDLTQTIKDADNTESIDDLFELYKEDEEESMNGNDTK